MIDLLKGLAVRTFFLIEGLAPPQFDGVFTGLAV
jgi:hypothetical protein